MGKTVPLIFAPFFRPSTKRNETMFAVTETHLSGTKRVVLCNARNETKRGMQGQPKLPRQARVLLDKQGKPMGTCIRRRQASFSQWVTFNEERPINTRRYLQ